MSGLVAAWIDCMCSIPGFERADALADLNADLGTQYTASRLGEWINARRPIPDNVRQYMLRSAITYILRQHGIATARLSDAQIDGLADSLI
jgi:hypothetical protein